MAQIILDNGNRSMNANLDLGGNNLTNVGTINVDFVSSDDLSETNFNVELDMQSNNISNVGDVELDSITKDGVGDISFNDSLDLNENNINNAGDVELDSLTKDGTGTINVNDTFNVLHNIQMNNNQINMQDSGSGRIINLHNPSGETDDRAATKGYVDDEIANSDERVKKNVSDYETDLGLLEKIQVRSWDWDTNHPHSPPEHIPSIGLVGQELEQIAPEFVTTKTTGESTPDANDSIDDFRKVHYAKLTALLIGAVQELSTRVEELENAGA